MRCHLTHIALTAGTVLALLPASFAAPSIKVQDDSSKLLNNVAAEARQVESSAWQFEKLSKDPSATWRQYDREWNAMEPTVEMMQIKIARLEAMESSLSASEKQALERTKADLQRVVRQSRDLGNLVDKVPANVNNPNFKIESRDLAREAGDIAKVAKSGA